MMFEKWGFRTAIAAVGCEAWGQWVGGSCFSEQRRAPGGAELDGISLATIAMAAADGATECTSRCQRPSLAYPQKSLWCFVLLSAI